MAASPQSPRSRPEPRSAFARGSFGIGHAFGVPLRVHLSWIPIAALIVVAFWARTDSLYHVSTVEALAVAVGGTIVFFGSVLVHELAHAVVARARGIEVRGITLFLFGGATEADPGTERAVDELTIAAVGPLTSAAIAVVLGAVALATGSGDAVTGTIGYLAWVNLALAVFNMLPGFPLDGGRVFRAIVWKVTGDFDRATRVAAMGGVALGYGLVALGLLSVLGGALGGLWLAAIGWFLSQTARASVEVQHARELLARLAVRDVMSHPLVTIPADVPLDRAVQEWFLHHDHSSFPVDDAGRVVGLVTLACVRRVPAGERAVRHVRDCMVPIADVPVVDADEPAEVLVERVGASDAARVLVRDHDRIVGLVSARDLARVLQRRELVSGGRGGA